MEKHEIETLREKVTCAIVLEAAGWKVDLKESTRRAVKFRRGDGEIIIVIHDGRGWFDPLSPKKGDISISPSISAPTASSPPAIASPASLGSSQPSLPGHGRRARSQPPRFPSVGSGE